MARWVNDEVWQEREIYNRAPRSAIVECKRTPRFRAVRAIVKFVLLAGFLAVALLGMFRIAQP
jgi:hypothetical protein